MMEGMSFWAIEEKTGDSWIWRKLLYLRPLAEWFVRCTLGNGTAARFWFDHWTPLGPLIKCSGISGPSELGLPSHSCVASASTNYGWRLRAARSTNALELQMYLTTIEIPIASHCEDEYFWHTTDGYFDCFVNAQSTWNDLRPHDTQKDWAKKIWFKGATPRHAFTMWVAKLDRLPTRQRLASWGLTIPSSCCICSKMDESRASLPHV